MLGRLKKWWGEFIGGELEWAGGRVDQFVALLQQKYGAIPARAAVRLVQVEVRIKRGSRPC